MACCFRAFHWFFSFPVPGSFMASETIVVELALQLSPSGVGRAFSLGAAMTHHCDCTQRCAVGNQERKDQLARDTSLGAGHNCLSLSVAGHLNWLVEKQLP
jgi:hypothetical protein